MIDAFLLGVIATASLAAGLFFLRFWRDTRDSLFLAFAIAFFVEGLNRVSMLAFRRANEGSPWNYVVGLVAFLVILGGIVNKNRKSRA